MPGASSAGHTGEEVNRGGLKELVFIVLEPFQDGSLQENHPYGPGFIFVGILIFSDILTEACRNAGSVAGASEWGITFQNV